MNSTPPRRKYNSDRRKAQAIENQRRILDAASILFEEKGYSGATIEAIGTEAGVAPETIYAVFRNKRTILASLIRLKVAGDDRHIPLLMREGPQAVLHEQNGLHQLEMFAADMAAILDRVTPVFEIMRAAAKTETEINELMNKILGERYHNLEKFIQNLSQHSGFREGMNLERAVEDVWIITSPEVFHLARGYLGWSQEQYVRWLSDSLKRQLLP